MYMPARAELPGHQFAIELAGSIAANEPSFMNSNPTPTDNFEAQGKPDQAKQPSKEQSLHTETITPGAQPPVETQGIHQGKRREIAGGLPGVEEAVRYAWGRMGIVKGT